MGEYMTLRQLQQRISSTKGVEVSGKKMFETLEPLEVYISSATPEYSISVYENGFALAKSGKRWTIVRVDKCGDYVYEHADSTLDDPEFIQSMLINANVFLDQPWPIRVVMTADDQLWENEKYRERGALGRHPEIPDDKKWMCGGYESFEARLVARMDLEEALKALTWKQQEVLILYYEGGYTQDEIGEILGIAQSSVKERLLGAMRKLSKLL